MFRSGVWVGLCVGLSLGASGCAVGSLKSPPAAEASLSSSQLSLREQAAILAQTSWDQVRGQSASFASITSTLIDGRGKDEAGSGQTFVLGQSTASAYLGAMSAQYTNQTDLVAAITTSVARKSSEVDRFIANAGRLSQGSGELSAEDRQVVRKTCAQLKRQRATFEAVERELARGEAPADTTALVEAIDGFQDRIVELDAIVDTIAIKNTV